MVKFKYSPKKIPLVRHSGAVRYLYAPKGKGSWVRFPPGEDVGASGASNSPCHRPTHPKVGLAKGTFLCGVCMFSLCLLR